MKGKSLTGEWVHPADGENYPVELTMKVRESTGALGVIAWDTEVDYSGQGFGVSRWQYCHGQGAHGILYSIQRKDGTWSPTSVMSMDRWSVADGSTDAARELMREFFTEGGYTKKERP